VAKAEDHGCGCEHVQSKEQVGRALDFSGTALEASGGKHIFFVDDILEVAVDAFTAQRTLAVRTTYVILATGTSRFSVRTDE